MADGFSVDLGALESAASGVDDTLTDLRKVPIDSPGGKTLDYGHDHLAGTVKDFCDRWEIGVEHLGADGREVVQRLKQSVQDYLAADKAAKGRMDGIFASRTEPDPAAH
jgi:hypothetical protein